MRVVFWILGGFLYNIWRIVLERAGKAGDAMAKYLKKKAGLSPRCHPMFDLSHGLVGFGLDSEIGLEGGDRSKARWASNQDIGRFKRKPPSTEPGAHDLKPLVSKKNYFCQQCYQTIQEKEAEKPEAERLAKSEVIRQSNKAIGYCQECGWRFCSGCNTPSNHEAKGGAAHGGKRSRLN